MRVELRGSRAAGRVHSRGRWLACRALCRSSWSRHAGGEARPTCPPRRRSQRRRGERRGPRALARRTGCVRALCSCAGVHLPLVIRTGACPLGCSARSHTTGGGSSGPLPASGDVRGESADRHGAGCAIRNTGPRGVVDSACSDPSGGRLLDGSRLGTRPCGPRSAVSSASSCRRPARPSPRSRRRGARPVRASGSPCRRP